MNHVLIVDDEAEIRDSLESILREEDYLVTTAATAPRPSRSSATPPTTSSCSTSGCPTATASTLSPRFARWRRANVPEVIIISGHGTIEAAVRATKLGAYDFLEKPLSLDRTLIVLKNAMKARQMREDNQEFSRQLAKGTVTGKLRPHEGPPPADQADGPHQRPRPHLRRIRHRQRAHRPRHARRKPPQRPRLRRAQLRRHPRGLHRDPSSSATATEPSPAAPPKSAAPSSAPTAEPSSSTKSAT